MWARNGTAEDGGAPYYEETGSPLVSSYRANGNRTQVELPVTFPWGPPGTDTQVFEISAYLPGGGRIPAASASVTVSNPDPGLGGPDTQDGDGGGDDDDPNCD